MLEAIGAWIDRLGEGVPEAMAQGTILTGALGILTAFHTISKRRMSGFDDILYPVRVRIMRTRSSTRMRVGRYATECLSRPLGLIIIRHSLAHHTIMHRVIKVSSEHLSYYLTCKPFI